jgi:hypothetical protein
MHDRDDYVLTDPTDWTWTFGLEHEPAEPNSVLLPGRVDAPASKVEGSSVIGQFNSQPAAAAAADALSGICVSETVILPNQPYPWDEHADATLAAVIDQFKDKGARDVFVTDADTGYLTQFDIRAHCENREQALAIGRQMAPILWPPWVNGLIKPWAPGRRLTGEQVRARMYIASLWGRSNRQPQDEFESKIWDIWQAWQQDQKKTAAKLVAGATVDDQPAIKGHEFEADLHAMLGEEPEEWGLPWNLQWKVLIDEKDVCLSSISCQHAAASFPALVRWLKDSGVRSAEYSVYNLIRP